MWLVILGLAIAIVGVVWYFRKLDRETRTPPDSGGGATDGSDETRIIKPRRPPDAQ